MDTLPHSAFSPSKSVRRIGSSTQISSWPARWIASSLISGFLGAPGLVGIDHHSAPWGRRLCAAAPADGGPARGRGDPTLILKAGMPSEVGLARKTPRTRRPSDGSRARWHRRARCCACHPDSRQRQVDLLRRQVPQRHLQRLVEAVMASRWLPPRGRSTRCTSAAGAWPSRPGQTLAAKLASSAESEATGSHMEWPKPRPVRPSESVSSRAKAFRSVKRTWLSPMTRSRRNWKRVSWYDLILLVAILIQSPSPSDLSERIPHILATSKFCVRFAL